MKIRTEKFKGRIPKIADRALPNQNATVATNCDLLSGNLKPYYSAKSVTSTGKSGTIASIYEMTPGSTSTFLTWGTNEVAPSVPFVTVASGPLLNDSNNTIVYTSAADYTSLDTPSTTVFHPKITNNTLAFTTPVQSTYPPMDWRLLGVPAPGSTLTATSVVNTSLVTSTTLIDGSSLTDFSIDLLGASSVISIDNVIGNAAPSIKMVCNDASVTSRATSYANVGGFAGYMDCSCDFYFDDNNTPAMAFVFGADYLGNNGLAIKLFRLGLGSGSPVTSVEVSTSSTSWDELGGSVLDFSNTSASLANGNWYTLHITATPLSADLSAFLVKITIKTAGGASRYSKTITSYTPTTNSGSNFGVTVYNAAGVTGTIHIDNMTTQSLVLVNDPSYEVTSYVQTYYTDQGYEGPPGSASNLVWIGPSLTTTVTNFDNTPTAGYGVVGWNLYRAVTGPSTTAFQFVTQNTNLTTTSYTDSLLDSQLGEVLSTDTYDLPPATSRYITTMSNGITLLGSINTLCPSVQYIPYAYPVSYRLATDYPIRGIFDIESQAVILTTGSAYLCTGSDPSAMTLTRLTPTYGCISNQSATRWNLSGATYTAGVIYASNEGLVLVNGMGATLVTKEFITPKQWQTQYNPSTIIGATYQDMYVGIYYNTNTSQYAGFIFDPREQGLGFVDITLNTSVIHRDPLKDILYYVDTNTIYSWNTGNTPLTYTWKSKLYELPYRGTFQAAQVRGIPSSGYTSVSMSTYLDSSGSAAYTVTPSSNREFVLPAKQGYDIQYQLSGTSEIATVEMAELMEELE